MVVDEGGIDRFKDGFWINGKMKLTKGDDCHVWIPPSQIQMIEKGAMP